MTSPVTSSAAVARRSQIAGAKPARTTPKRSLTPVDPRRAGTARASRYRIGMRAFLIVALLAGVATAKPKHEAGAVAILIDRSGSMQGPKLEAAKEAARTAVEALDGSDQVTI